MSGFINYFLVYYSKYFEGNFYVNYCVQGIAVVFSLIWATILSKKASLTNVLKLLTFLVFLFSCIAIVIIQTCTDQQVLYFLPIVLVILRLQVCTVQNFGYHVNQFLFPVLVRGQAYGIVNFVSRPFASIAAIITEYVTNPVVYMAVFSFITIFVIFLIQEEETVKV